MYPNTPILATANGLFFLYMYVLHAALTPSGANIITEQYLAERDAILEAEDRLRIGGSLPLNREEKKVNNLLMTLKGREIEEALKGNKAMFPPSMHFFRAKPLIEKGPIYRIIKAMPKGAVLHTHLLDLVDKRWLIRRATYDPNCYMCRGTEGQLTFHFFSEPPNDEGCDWKSVKEEREAYQSAEDFDNWLYSMMTLVVEDPEKAYPNREVVWKKFKSTWPISRSLTEYLPVFRDYIYEALSRFDEDNVDYLEIRCLLSQVYDIDGCSYGDDGVVQTFMDVVSEFKITHPDFNDAKLILTSARQSNNSQIRTNIQRTIALKHKYPAVIAGFDLAGDEDLGHPDLHHLEELLLPRRMGIDLPYFLHAGETNWLGMPSDENLLDALLLNASRIGHGFAVTKHPVVLQMLRAKQIPIEVNPIANQVLKLVVDLRNHPASELMAEGYPVVISCDNLAVWDADGVSFDYYEAFMGLGGANADLATIKQLIINSILYSATEPDEKDQMLLRWRHKWDDFIRKQF